MSDDRVPPVWFVERRRFERKAPIRSINVLVCKVCKSQMSFTTKGPVCYECN